jgi:hypothetical protein
LPPVLSAQKREATFPGHRAIGDHVFPGRPSGGLQQPSLPKGEKALHSPEASDLLNQLLQRKETHAQNALSEAPA